MPNSDNSYRYTVGGLTFDITLGDNPSGMRIPDSFTPFKEDREDMRPAFSVSLKSGKPAMKGTNLGIFPSADAAFVILRGDDGAHGIAIFKTHAGECAGLIVNPDFTRGSVYVDDDPEKAQYGFETALMLMYTLAAIPYGILTMHSSVVRKDGQAYMCLGKSGTGKSTHTRLWMDNIQGCDLINDDNPLVACRDGKVVVYGSPWSGKTPCYRNVSAPVKAFLQLKQAPYNKIRRLSNFEALAYVLPSVSVMKCEPRTVDKVCDTVSDILESVPVYMLECLPDADAALLSYSTMSQE